MPVRPLIYLEDLTGNKPQNKIIDEMHLLIPGIKKVIAPQYAPFYKEGLIIEDIDNNNVLLETDYQCIEIQSLLSAITGKQVSNIILITNPLVSNNIKITYQTVGGEYSRSYASTKSLLDKLYSDTRPVLYNNLTDKPSEFNPVLHLHAIGDLIGFEYVVAALERVRNAILIQNSLATDTILKYLDDKITVINNQYNSLLQDYNDLETIVSSYSNHQLDTNNPHQTTKSQVGLSNVENYLISTLAELQTPVSNDPKYVVNTILKEYLDIVINNNANTINNSLNLIETDITELELDSQTLTSTINIINTNLTNSINLKNDYITLLGISNSISANLLTAQTRTQNLISTYF